MGIPLTGLAVRPPAQEPMMNPMEYQEKSSQLKSLGLQQRGQEQALQINDLQKQQQELALKSSKAMTAAMQSMATERSSLKKGSDVDSFDGNFYDELSKRFMDNGGDGETAMKLQTAGLDYSKKLGDVNKDSLDNRAKLHNQIDEEIAAVKDLDPADQEAAFNLKQPGWINTAKGIDPDLANFIGQVKYKDPSTLDLLQMFNGAENQMVANTKNKAEAGASQAKNVAGALTLAGQTLGGAADQNDWDSRMEFLKTQPGITKDLLDLLPDKFSPDSVNMVSQLGMTPDEISKIPLDKLGLKEWQAAQRKAGKPSTVSAYQTYLTTQEAKAKAKGELEGQMEAVGGNAGAAGNSPVTQTQLEPGSRNEDYLKTLPPSIATQVKAYDEGRLAFPSGMALRSPYFQQMLKMIGNYDPSFDGVNYNARAQLRQHFTSGAEASQMTSINKLAGHMEELSDVAKALSNGNWLGLNWIKNKYNVAVGKNGVTNFLTVVHRVAPELVQAYKEAGGQGNIEAAMSDFNENASPSQLQGAITETTRLIQSLLNNLEGQYSRGMNMGKSDLKLITPEAKKVLDNFSAGKFDWDAKDGKKAAPEKSQTPTAAPARPTNVPEGYVRIKSSKPDANGEYYHWVPSLAQAKTVDKGAVEASNEE